MFLSVDFSRLITLHCSSQSLLIRIPPPFPPLFDKVENLLTPSYTLLQLAHESLVSGDQQKFAKLVWAKAWTKEPFVLANRVCSRIWERWRDVSDDGDDASSA